MSEDPAPLEVTPSHLRLQLDETIPGDVSAIGPVVERIMGFVGELGCIQGKEFEIELVLREALANAIVHGCKLDPAKEVEVRVECDPAQGLLITVQDPGEGFDWETLPDPLSAERLYLSHGRGIYLINQLMDEVSFEERGTRIRMRKAKE